MRVVFTGKEHRMRRRETILNPPSGIEFIPQQPLSEMKKDYQLTGKKYIHKKSLFQTVNDFLKYGNYIPKKFLKNINLIYSPGKIILNRFPWVIEIDNVAVLTYYNLKLLKFLKPFLKRKLKSKYCRSIICISEAAKKSVINFFNDDEISKKCIVVYPYVKYHEPKKKERSAIKLLYICSQFYLKGGKEILHSFEKLNKKYKNLELHMITNAPKEVINEYSKYKNIYFISPNLDKKQLYEKYYTQCDIFLQLSYQDSFGLVNLEAISCGMPVIATDMFAIPEIVINNKNGFILKSPIKYFNDNFLPNPKFWNIDINSYAREHDFPDIENELTEKLEILIKDEKLRKKMSRYSLWLVKKGKFNENKRKKALKKALMM